MYKPLVLLFGLLPLPVDSRYHHHSRSYMQSKLWMIYNLYPTWIRWALVILIVEG